MTKQKAALSLKRAHFPEHSLILSLIYLDRQTPRDIKGSFLNRQSESA